RPGGSPLPSNRHRGRQGSAACRPCRHPTSRARPGPCPSAREGLRRRLGAMSASGGSKAIVAALLANLGIAVAKFIAWALSGSASMLAEAIHSVADSGNQLLLMLGGRKASKRADQA